MKKGIIMLIIGLCGLTLCVGLKNIVYRENNSNPDSGYDYDYDGGSSDWDSGGSSSYDYDYDNDYDYDYNYGSSSHGHSSGGTKCTGDWWSDCGGRETIIILSIFMGIPTIIFIIGLIKDKTKDNKIKQARVDEIFTYNQNAYDILTKEGFDTNYILERAYQIYYEVQNGWMNYDYNSLRKNLSDELYNEYKIQLDTLRLKNQQNKMTDISKSKIVICDVIRNKGTYTIIVHLGVKQKDYIVNMNNPSVPLRGDKRLHDVYYELTFEMTKDRTNFCSNCGATLDGNVASQTCPYCNSIVISKNHDLIMLKKKILGQNIFKRR